VQTLTPSEMRGRVMAARITVIQGGLALGSALGGYLLVVMPVSRVWLVLAGLMLLASAMVWLPTGVRTQA
jgi:predicted MFS family arabinose efflux permease